MGETSGFDADVVIVGGGPIGLEVHWALAREGARVVHLEAGEIGATMGWWAPGTRYFSSPERIEICAVPLVTANQDKATREEYMAYLRQVAGARKLRVRTGRRVLDVRALAQESGGGFEVEHAPSAHGVGGPDEQRGGGVYGDAELVSARRVVLAIGNMHRPRMLGVPGEDMAHVTHYLRDPGGYFGREVVVVGGKNSAVEAAIRLYRAGARVTMSYRGRAFDAERIKYWLLPEIEWLIKKGQIGFEPETVPAEIRAGSVALEGVGSRAGERVEAGCQDVVLLTGYVQDGELFDRLGVEREGEVRRPVFNPRTMETNVPGVHVAGTACGGTQTRATVFIETSHVHAERIAAAVLGRDPRRDVGGEVPDYGAMEES